MKFFSFRHIIDNLPSLTALIAASLLTGCNLVEGPEHDCADTDDITISFRIFTGNPSSSRAVDENGNTGENYIDLEDFKILVFDKDQKLKQVLYDNHEWDEKNTRFTELGPGFYHVVTHLAPSMYDMTSEFAIVGIANWNSSDPKLTTDLKELPLGTNGIGTLTIADLKTTLFTLNPVVTGSQPDSWMPGDDNDGDKKKSWIPMFGSSYTSLKNYDAGIYNEGHPMPLPDVRLVRAITKIEVINNDHTGPTIKGIDLVNRNQKGHLVQEYDFTGFTSNVSAPTIPKYEPGPEFTNYSLPFHQNDNVYTAYIPEMKFEAGVSRQAIRVTIDMNGTEHVKWIYLAEYDNSNQPILDSFGFDWENIKRNYIYQYTINSLAFEFLVDVKEWVFGGKVHIDADDIEEILPPA